MYTNPHSYSLPQELTGMVMSNLARDLPSLSTASLVSKSWLAESSRFLFRDLAVTKPPGMDHSLLEFLKTSERVRKNVRALHLAPAGGAPGMLKRPEDFQGFAFDKLLQIMVHLPRINEIHMSSLRLDCDTEEPAGLSQLKSRNLILLRLMLSNVPTDPATVRCYTQLIGSICNIAELSVGSSMMHHWAATPQPSSGSFGEFIPSSPLHIQSLYVGDGWLSSPYLEWLSNVYTANTKSLRVRELRMDIWPHMITEFSDRASTINFIQSLEHLEHLTLHLRFTECALIITKTTGRLSLPDLSALHRLKSLRISNIFCGHDMDILTGTHGTHLRAMWELLVDMLKTAPLGIPMIHLDFRPHPSLRSIIAQNNGASTVRDWGPLHNFLHDGSPESASQQVYDWGLLAKLAAGRKSLKHILFTAYGTSDDLADCGGLPWWKLGSKVVGVWKRYPNSARIIQEALPKIARLRTGSSRVPYYR